MDKVAFRSVFPLLIALFLIKGCQCQEVDSCRYNRLEDYPCDFRIPGTREPKENEYGIYTTRIKHFHEGNKIVSECKIRRRNRQIRKLDSINDDSRVWQIFSPGRELQSETDYGNQMYVRYELSCPENHILTYKFVDREMEEKNCPNPNKNGTLECVDFIIFHARNDENGDIIPIPGKIYCGIDTDAQDNEVNVFYTRRARAIFRTDPDGRYPDVDSRSGRKKRDIEEFNNVWKRQLSRVMRWRKIFGGRFRRYCNSRFEQISVQSGSILNYHDTKLTVRVEKTEVTTRQVSRIRWLHTFGESSDSKRYWREAVDSRRKPIDFHGAGTLTIVGYRAYFIPFIVDDQNIQPKTEAERTTLRLLSRAHFDRVLEFPDEELCDEMLNPPKEELPCDTPECPRPKTTKPLSCNVTNEILGLALQSVNATNRVIRTIADVFVNCTRRTQPGRIDNVPLRPQPLAVRCNHRVVNRIITVSCDSNRQTGGVRISSCLIDGRTSILTNCTFPSFQFSSTPGSHTLNMRFIDSVDFEDTDEIVFSVL